MGLWGYLASEDPSVTALIPVATGVVLLLIKPLSGSIERTDSSGLVRVSIMMIASVIALATFIKSFMDARKERKSV